MTDRELLIPSLPIGGGGVATSRASSDAARIAEAIECLAAAVEQISVPPGPCPAMRPGLLDHVFLCTLRTGHVGQHESATDDGYARWSEEDQ